MQEQFIGCTGNCLFLLPFALLPSIVWLLFFVFADKHREKAKNIIKIFLWGAASAFPVVIVETAGQEIIFAPLTALALAPFLYLFIGIAFVEEFAKYLVVRLKALPSAFFDEPQDAMVYMITAALGFAAVENIVYVLDFAQNFDQILQIVGLRGVTATFLHVVASGTLGYFLALSLANPDEQKKFLYTGIIAATLLHGIYNNFIIRIEEQIIEAESLGGLFGVSLVASLLIISGIILLTVFNRLGRTRFAQSTQE